MSPKLTDQNALNFFIAFYVEKVFFQTESRDIID